MPFPKRYDLHFNRSHYIVYRLYNPGDIVSNAAMVSTRFIDDCINEKKLLNVEDYRSVWSLSIAYSYCDCVPDCLQAMDIAQLQVIVLSIIATGFCLVTFHC